MKKKQEYRKTQKNYPIMRVDAGFYQYCKSLSRELGLKQTRITRIIYGIMRDKQNPASLRKEKNPKPADAGN